MSVQIGYFKFQLVHDIAPEKYRSVEFYKIEHQEIYPRVGVLPREMMRFASGDDAFCLGR